MTTPPPAMADPLTTVDVEKAPPMVALPMVAPPTVAPPMVIDRNPAA